AHVVLIGRPPHGWGMCSSAGARASLGPYTRASSRSAQANKAAATMAQRRAPRLGVSSGVVTATKGILSAPKRRDQSLAPDGRPGPEGRRRRGVSATVATVYYRRCSLLILGRPQR